MCHVYQRQHNTAICRPVSSEEGWTAFSQQVVPHLMFFTPIGADRAYEPHHFPPPVLLVYVSSFFGSPLSNIWCISIQISIQHSVGLLVSLCADCNWKLPWRVLTPFLSAHRVPWSSSTELKTLYEDKSPQEGNSPVDHGIPETQYENWRGALSRNADSSTNIKPETPLIMCAYVSIQGQRHQT